MFTNSNNNDNNFFDDFINEMTAANLQSQGDMSIIEFANRIIFNNDPDFALYPTQKAILKSFYKESLTEEEVLILKEWLKEERTTWVKDRKYISLVLEAGRRGSKCWKLDDVLTITDKGLYYIEEIAKENAINLNNTGWSPLINKMSAIQEQGKEREITDIYVENKVKTKRIITREGYAFEATPEHKIKVLEPDGIIKWKEFQYINSQDYVVINKRNNYLVKDYYKIPLDIEYKKQYEHIRPFKTPLEVNNELGYFLGVLCGDGTWKSSSCHIASHQDDEPILQKIFIDLFGASSYEAKKDKQSGKCKLIKIGNSNLKKIINYLGYKLKDNNEKQVPWVIRRSPKSVIASFISGLFDTDGTVVKNGRSIEFCAKDYTLIRELQQLLLLFGIISSIKQHYNKRFKTFHWKLKINGLEGRQIFAKEIGFKLPRKQKLILDNLNLREGSKEGGYLLSIPYQQNILYSFKESLNIPKDNFAVKNKDSKTMYSNFAGRIKSDKSYRTQFRDIVGNCCKKNNKENITYPKLLKLLEWGRDILPEMVEHYNYISNNDFFFSKIEELNDSIADVGDINVETTHKYIANGCISHNCNSISSIIPTTKGDITYGELHNYLSNKEKIGIYTYNFNNNIVDKYITYNIKTELNAVEQTYIIKTAQGKQEIVNEDHPFLTWDRSSTYPYWKKLKDLKPKDFIAVSGNLPIFGEEEIENNLLEAYAIALTTPSIYTNISCPNYLKSFLNNVFSKKDIQKLTIPINKILKLTQPKLKFFLSCIVKYGDSNFELTSLPTKTSEADKRIIQNIKESFILVFWLKDFQLEISNLFLKFGINFKVREHGIKLNLTTSKYTLVDVFGDICYNYPNLRKRLLKANQTSFVDKEDIIPPISTYDNSVIYHDYKKNRNYKKSVLKRVVLKQENPDPKLLDWATNEINWERIKSITPYKIEQTIALEVEGTNVIGNYIISHNSTMASIIALKEFYDLIILDNPHKKYGILRGSPIAILVMAQSQAQVKETIFAAIKGYANNSRFFTSLQNKGIIEILSEEIRCQEKNVSIYAKHTNSKSLVGYTLKCMLLDEVARFETLGEEGKNKAFEIWENVAAGGSTFGHDFKKVAISSAWEPNDPIEILYNRAQKDPNTLAFKLTTFQVNLKLQKGITPVIVSDYTNDYIKARREYEGIRFNKFNTFIDIENLNKAATSVSIIDALPCEIDTKTNAGIAHYAGIEITRIAENELDDGVSFIHVDPALKKDSAALAIARAVKTENKWKIQIDALIKWEPHTDNNGLKRIVSFIDIEDKLNDIAKIRRIGRITFDQWNSVSLIQKLQANGIDAQIASCSRENQFTYYTLFRDLLAHDYIILPKDSLWTNSAITELSELVLRPNRQIIHPTAGKDIADAIVNAVYQCHQHMIRTGLNLNMGINTNVVASQSLAPLQRINVTTPTKTKEHLKIGSAIEKLYNTRKKLK